MSYYETYKFISPERIYTKIQEELRSYFSTGAIDTVLFPLWTEDCVKKFRKTFLPIKQAYVCVKDGMAEIPEDFKSVREAWMTHSFYSNPLKSTGSRYFSNDYSVVTARDITSEDGFGVSLNVDTYAVVRKVTQETVRKYNCTQRLLRGHIQHVGNSLLYDDSEEGCLKTGIQDGGIHLIYYATGTDDYGEQLIPDDFLFGEYLQKYITYKIFLQLFNMTTDETFNQMKLKKDEAKQEMYEAWVACNTETKSDTTERKVYKAKRAQSRLDRYKIR